MSEKVLIACDSTADLNEELINRYGIKIIPLGVNLGDKNYTDGVDIDPDMIYDHYEKTKQLPKTAAVNVATVTDYLKKWTDGGCSVVLFTISSEMSSTYNNARLASLDFENVYVVDTRNLSTGGGLLVLKAAKMAEEGADAESIAKACGEAAKKVDASFIIDSLEFLHKGGRCSSLEAIGANLLQIKPCIVVKDGKMGVGRKYRGKFGFVLQKYIADQLSDSESIDTDTVFVTHAGCDKEIVDMCTKAVKSALPFKDVHITRAGCTISSHCGRNTLGVLFLRK